jgi:hypothetical protein
MWMVPPAVLCDKHLLGEHGELHKHLSEFAKYRSITGRIKSNCIEPRNYKARHDALAAEMARRGMRHKSPLVQPDISYLPEHEQMASVDQHEALITLIERCPECEERAAHSIF